MNIENIVYGLHPLERKVLPFLNLKYLSQISKKTEMSPVEAMRAIQWLNNKDVVEYKRLVIKNIVLDKYGMKYLKDDLPEVQILKKLTTKEISLDDLKKNIKLDPNEINVSIGLLKKKGLIYTSKDNKTNKLLLSKSEPGIIFLKKYTNPLNIFKTNKDITSFSKTEISIYQELLKRKNIVKETEIKDFIIKITNKGTQLIEYISKNKIKLDFIETVTEDLIKNETWKKNKFRHYDVTSKVPLPSIGRRHPMMEANNILRDVFLDMGFQEMEGPMIESAFWNMDVMWIPQDHPARDEQDTFYLEGKADVPKELAKEYKKMHEDGVVRGHTTKGDWSKEISQKRLLRTHSTATTFRTLYELGQKLQKGENINGKYFYNANIFRNEAVDATHLTEFYQSEGFIIGDDLSLADLMGFVKEYYTKLGINKIKFKPTFNPYTEPSMEAHYYDEKLGKWYALINSGIFRPETLKPLGLENKTIIAWGMGASRVAAILSGKSSMRDITGATCDLEWLQNRKLTKKI